MRYDRVDTWALHAHEIEASLDRVFGFWEEASRQAGIKFPFDKHAARRLVPPTQPEMDFEVWRNLDFEIRWGVGKRRGGDYTALTQERASVTTGMDASDAVFIVNEIALMLGRSFRRHTGQSPYPQGWDEPLPEVTGVHDAHGQWTTYYLGEAGSPAYIVIGSYWEPVPCTRILTHTTDELLPVMVGDARR